MFHYLYYDRVSLILDPDTTHVNQKLRGERKCCLVNKSQYQPKNKSLILYFNWTIFWLGLQFVEAFYMRAGWGEST